MVAPRSGTNLDRERVRVRLPSGLTRHPSGNAMGAKTRPQKAKRKKSRNSPAPAHAASMASVATQNLINMVAVSATSGAVLLALLATRHF